MATVKGQTEVHRYMAKLPGLIEKTLRGAVREAAKVVAEEARQRCTSDMVRGAIKVKTPRLDTTPGRAVARVEVSGKGSFLGPWLEYGTAPHLISVSDADRDGKSVGQINREAKRGSLVIGGRFVGPTVAHPGTRPEPFMRTAMDAKSADARAAAQTYINKRFRIGGDIGADED